MTQEFKVNCNDSFTRSATDDGQFINTWV